MATCSPAKRYGAFTAAAFSGMMPFSSMLLSVTILGERAGLHQWSGGFLVILGMVLIGIGNIPIRTSLLRDYENSKEKAVK